MKLERLSQINVRRLVNPVICQCYFRL